MEKKVVEEAAKKVIKRPRKSDQMLPQVEAGENTKFLNHSLEIFNLPKIDTNDVVQVNQRINDYFTICARNDMKPNVPGLALSLGVDRKTLWTWKTDQVNKPQEVRNSVKNAYAIINSMLEDWMQNGKINPVSAIFIAKNNYEYQDKTEVVVTPNQPLGAESDQKTLEQKYTDDVVFEVVDDKIKE